LLNNSVKLLAQVDFLTPMIFRISAAKQLAPRSLPRRSDSFTVPVLSSAYGVLHGDSLNAQAPLAKIDIRSNLARVIF